MAEQRSAVSTRRLAWALLALVVVAALIIGAFGRRSLEGEDRVQALSAQIKCVTCVGESVAGSQSDFAVNAREDIRTRVEAGDSDAEIFAYFSSRYDDVLLNPSASGAGALLWVLPVVVFGAAVAGAVVTVRQRGERGERPTADDRRLVAAAMAEWRQTGTAPEGSGDGG